MLINTEWCHWQQIQLFQVSFCDFYAHITNKAPFGMIASSVYKYWQCLTCITHNTRVLPGKRSLGLPVLSLAPPPGWCTEHAQTHLYHRRSFRWPAWASRNCCSWSKTQWHDGRPTCTLVYVYWSSTVHYLHSFWTSPVDTTATVKGQIQLHTPILNQH